MKKITDRLYVSAQPSESDLREAARAGVVRIVNNRPDGEDEGQPTASAQAARAADLGMDHAHVPVTMGGIDEGSIRAFQRSVADADGPVLAHCRSGMRSLVLHVLGETLDGRMTPAGFAELEARSGIDLTAARRWLEARGLS